MATTSASNRQNPPNDEGSGDHKKTDGDPDKGQMFDCNICLDTAKDAVISMCGHLFCWPCLHQWLETCPNRQTCPVCKAAIDKDKVIPVYGRGGSSKTDPRDKVPPRPQGQRTEPDTNGRDMDYSDYDEDDDEEDDLDDSEQDDDGGQSTTWDDNTADETTGDDMTAATDDLDQLSDEFSTDDGDSIEEGVEAEEYEEYEDAAEGSEVEVGVDVDEEMYSDEESEEDEYEEEEDVEEEESYDDTDSS